MRVLRDPRFEGTCTPVQSTWMIRTRRARATDLRRVRRLPAQAGQGCARATDCACGSASTASAATACTDTCSAATRRRVRGPACRWAASRTPTRHRLFGHADLRAPLAGGTPACKLKDGADLHGGRRARMERARPSYRDADMDGLGARRRPTETLRAGASGRLPHDARGLLRQRRRLTGATRSPLLGAVSARQLRRQISGGTADVTPWLNPAAAEIVVGRADGLRRLS